MPALAALLRIGYIRLDDRVTLGPTAMRVLAKKNGLRREDL